MIKGMTQYAIDHARMCPLPQHVRFRLYIPQHVRFRLDIFPPPDLRVAARLLNRRANLGYQAERKDGLRRLETECDKIERKRLLLLEQHKKALAGQACPVHAISTLPLASWCDEGLERPVLLLCEGEGGEGSILDSFRSVAEAPLGMGCCEALLVADAAGLISQRWLEETSTPGHASQGPVSKPIANVVKRACKVGATICAIGERCCAVLSRLMHDPSVSDRASCMVLVCPSPRTLLRKAFSTRCNDLKDAGTDVTILLPGGFARSEDGIAISSAVGPGVSVHGLRCEEGTEVDMREVGEVIARRALKMMIGLDGASASCVVAGAGGKGGGKGDGDGDGDGAQEGWGVGPLLLSRMVISQGRGGCVGFEEVATELEDGYEDGDGDYSDSDAGDHDRQNHADEDDDKVINDEDTQELEKVVDCP
jgi:hypothetical protein